MSLYPLKFRPLFKERIWGGETLKQVMGKPLPESKKIGESWEVSGVPGDVSVVSEGKLKGNNLEELIEVYMGDLVGEKIYERYGVEFPVLIKLIDARDTLSIQVHPNDALALERHGSYGKTEMWYVIDAEPGAELCMGLKEGVTREQYVKAVEEGNVPDLLNKVKVSAGSTFFIPAGAIHAIGKGILIAEIQQTSDVTYRVDDWGRVDDNGNPRQLHTELALAAIDFSGGQQYDVTAPAVANQAVELKSCDYFTTNLIEVSGEMVRDYAAIDSFVIYISLDGRLDVEYSGGKVVLAKGESLLVPAMENEITLKGEGKLLEVYILA